MHFKKKKTYIKDIINMTSLKYRVIQKIDKKEPFKCLKLKWYADILKL